MDPQRPWDDAQVKQAAENLAILTVASNWYGEKQAEGFADALRGFANTASDYVGDAWRNLPQAAKNPLMYAGVGAAGGGLLGGLSSLSRDPEERRPFRSAVSGALAGAAGGAGLGLLRDQLPQQSALPASKGPDAPPAFQPPDLSQATDEELRAVTQQLQQRLMPSASNGELSATGAGVGVGVAAGEHAANRLLPKYRQHGLDGNSTLLERGAAGIDVGKAYKGRTDGVPDMMQRLQQPGGMPIEQQNAVMRDARLREQRFPSDPHQTIGSRPYASSPSEALPGASREELRQIMRRGRSNSRASLRARGIGGGVGGVAGGLLGNLGYNYFFPEE